MATAPTLPTSTEEVLQQLSLTLEKLGLTQKYGAAAINATFFNPANPRMTNNVLLLEAAFLGEQLPKEFLVSQAFAPPNAIQEKQIQEEAFTGLNAKVVRVNTAPGVSIQGWYMKPDACKPTILFSNGANGDFMRSKELITQLRSEGYGVLAYQFRGYGAGQGGSTGIPSEKGVYDDVKALSKLLAHGSKELGIEKTAYSKQVLMGYSLGGDVSAHLATNSRQRYQGLVLIDSPRSIKDAFEAQMKDTDPLAREITGPFQAGINAAKEKITGAFDISKAIKYMRTPTLFIQGGQDKLALPEIARNMFDSMKSPFKSLFEVRNADHNTIIGDANNADKVANRIDRFISHYDYNKIVQDMAGYCDKNGASIAQFSSNNNAPELNQLVLNNQHQVA